MFLCSGFRLFWLRFTMHPYDFVGEVYVAAADEAHVPSSMISNNGDVYSISIASSRGICCFSAIKPMIRAYFMSCSMRVALSMIQNVMFYEFKTLVNRLLCDKAQLIVGRFIHKFLKCLFLIIDTGHVKVNSPIHFIIGHATLDDVILRIIVFSTSTTTHKIKPFLVIGIKLLDFKLRVRLKIKTWRMASLPAFRNLSAYATACSLSRVT